MHTSQYVELLQEFLDRAAKLRLGSALHATDGYISPVDCGSMIAKDRFIELERIVNKAVKDGASLHLGGTEFRHAYLESGSYFSPTVIGDVHQGMEIANKERKCFSHIRN